MNKLSFSLVTDKKGAKFDISVSQKLFWIGLAGFMILLIICWYFDNYKRIKLYANNGVMYLCLGFFIIYVSGYFYSLIDFNGNNKQSKGFITFDENELTINNAKTFSYSDIDRIAFSGYDYKGAYINLNSDGAPFNSYGGDNCVEFVYKSNTYKFKFIVNSKEHRKKLVENIIPKMKLKTSVKY